jgi:hypothetical protein
MFATQRGKDPSGEHEYTPANLSTERRCEADDFQQSVSSEGKTKKKKRKKIKRGHITPTSDSKDYPPKQQVFSRMGQNEGAEIHADCFPSGQ